MRQNCWDFMKCDRGFGGSAAETGEPPCPVPSATYANGFLGGLTGGRACAFIVGVFSGRRRLPVRCGACEGSCIECSFFRTLAREEPLDFNVLAFLEQVRARGGVR